MNITPHTIDALLQAEDIEGLLEAGAPADEYAAESRNIAAALNTLEVDERTEDAIFAILSLEWVQSFELTPDELEKRLPAIRRVARRITSDS